jgi:23S rRNA (guanine745-N1)-methyltransferase
MSHLICPKCEQALTQTGNQWQCPDRHSYDTARQGYTNLLLVNQKKSKNPGDDADMVRARTLFLDAGSYQPISDALNAMVTRSGSVLDIGCGEGYYTERLTNHMTKHQGALASEIIGLDISREAVKHACRRSKDICWLVASGARPPVAPQSIDTVITLFTPLMPAGLDHALSTDGEVITAYTGKRHLYELRTQIYDDVNMDEYSPKLAMQDAGFECVEETRVNFRIQPNTNEQLQALLAMTPHRWKVSPDKAAQFALLASLDIEVDVVLNKFRRQQTS